MNVIITFALIALFAYWGKLIFDKVRAYIAKLKAKKDNQVITQNTEEKNN